MRHGILPTCRRTCKAQGIYSRRPCFVESSGEYERSECREARPELGRALLSDDHSWNIDLLLGGYGRKTFTLTMEHL